MDHHDDVSASGSSFSKNSWVPESEQEENSETLSSSFNFKVEVELSKAHA